MVGDRGKRADYNRGEDFEKVEASNLDSVKEALENSDQFEKKFPTADKFSYTHDSGYEVRIDEENDEIQVEQYAHIASDGDEIRPNRTDYIVHLAHLENEVSKEVEEVEERAVSVNSKKVGSSPFYDPNMD